VRTLLALTACCLLAACEPVAIALLGAGASTALRHNMDGVAARTFTAPAETVKSASIAAFERMGITLNGNASLEGAELLYGRAQNRDIEIEIEPITKHATRLRVTAKGSGFFYDHATAVELVQQTEKAIDARVAAARNAAPAAAAAGGSAN
jgi:hypothetical protein